MYNRLAKSMTPWQTIAQYFVNKQSVSSCQVDQFKSKIWLQCLKDFSQKVNLKSRPDGDKSAQSGHAVPESNHCLSSLMNVHNSRANYSL